MTKTQETIHELDRIAMRLKMLSYRMSLQDSKKLNLLSEELLEMIERVPPEVGADWPRIV